MLARGSAARATIHHSWPKSRRVVEFTARSREKSQNQKQSLVINNDRNAARTLTLPVAGERYTLSSSDLESKTVQLNGAELHGNETIKRVYRSYFQ